MIAESLAWRIERACIAAYPPRQTVRVGDWSVALSGGGSRRTNSASPLRRGAVLDPPTLASISAIYAAAGLPTIIRLPDLACDVDNLFRPMALSHAEGATRTLLQPLGSSDSVDEPRGEIFKKAPDRREQSDDEYGSTRQENVDGRTVTLLTSPDAGWLATRRRLAPGIEEPTRVAARLSDQACYVRIGIDAIGYTVLHDGIAVIEAVATDPTRRRRGLGRAIIATLIDWATRAGATHVALQVEATNLAACALYEQAGFTIDAYGYHYRRSTGCLTLG